MRGRNGHFVRDAEFFQRVRGALHHRRVRIRAHEDENVRHKDQMIPDCSVLIYKALSPMSRRYCMPSKRISAAASYARERASVKRSPSATTVNTRPPAVTT